MFKIAKANLAEPFVDGSLDQADAARASSFVVSEEWAGDLSNGVIRLGERAMALHGLDNRECGLLTMMRCYDVNDRPHILELFEQAATASSSFCYSTTIHLASGTRQPVFCVGESNGLEEKYAGNMLGMFVFPRFRIATVQPRQLV